MNSENTQPEFINNASQESIEKTSLTSSRKRKKVILYIIIAIIITVSVTLILDNGPDLGSGLGLLILIPLVPIVYFAFPSYLAILALRFSREKSLMDPLDKLTFFILLAFLAVFIFISVK